MLRLFIFALAATASSISFAQTKFNTSKPLILEYESKPWNKNPKAVDSSALLLRDNISKRIVQIELLETGEDTNLFIGHYSVNWGDKEVVPEVYLVPKELYKTADQLKKVEAMIKDGTLLRKPFFFRMNEKMNQVLTVYDTKEQALAAFEDYRKIRSTVKTPVGSAALEAQALAEKALAQKALDQTALEQLTDRQAIEAAEKRKQAELKKQQEQLAAEEKVRRQKLAQESAAEGLRLYKQEKYKEAEALFAKAMELDPSNQSFNFQYGVTLYRNENYNRSLVMLDLAKGADVNPAEREFFMASNYMKLKENDNAIRTFEAVKARNDKTLSAGAAFYAGVLHYQKESYEGAKSNFEFVLDHSSDPVLDKQSEAYIEQIANIMSFKAEAQKKFIFTLNGGLMYDSNILAVAKSQIDQPTDLAGFRWTYGGSVEYRPVYNMHHEFSTILSASDIYSTDQSFKAKTDFQSTDPLTFSLYAPYKYKGMALQRAYQMTLSPGYETTAMNADGSGSRENILNSVVLKNDHTFVMNENWFSTYSLEFRQDTSKIDTSTTPDDDLSATKYTLNTTQTFFQNSKKTEAWIAEAGIGQNKAKGANASYNRIDVAATYMAPWKWDTTWTARVGLYHSPYYEHTTGRTDNGQVLTLGLRKPFTESLAGTLSASYTNNGSSLATSDYNKYIIMTNFSWITYR